MTTKISYLIFLLESIDRDIVELEKYNNQIPNDRSYAFTLKKVIKEEIDRLKRQKLSILSVDVEIPNLTENDMEIKEEQKPQSLSVENSNINEVFNNFNSKKIKNAHRY